MFILRLWFWVFLWFCIFSCFKDLKINIIFQNWKNTMQPFIAKKTLKISLVEFFFSVTYQTTDIQFS